MVRPPAILLKGDRSLEYRDVRELLGILDGHSLQ